MQAASSVLEAQASSPAVLPTRTLFHERGEDGCTLSSDHADNDEPCCHTESALVPLTGSILGVTDPAVRKLTLNRSIACKRDRFDILALLTNAQIAQGTSNDGAATSSHTAFTGME